MGGDYIIIPSRYTSLECRAIELLLTKDLTTGLDDDNKIQTS
jgi:hypothetical protein